jgi:hypothetical protein
VTGANEQETPEAANRVPEANLDTLSWRVQPTAKSPQKIWVVVLIAVLAFVFGSLVLRNVLLGLAGFAIIFISTGEFWLGEQYKIDNLGASRRVGLSVTSMTWDQVKRVIVGTDSVKLSPLPEAGKMDPFRGVTLRFTSDNREEALGAIRRNLPDDVRLLEG